MQDEHLSCEQVRARAVELIASQDMTASLAEHLSTCDSCPDLLLDAALRLAPQVLIPNGFAARTASIAMVQRRSVVPYLAVAALALYVVLTLLWAPSIDLGAPIARFTAALTEPVTLLTLLALETLFSCALFWRVVRAG